MAEPLFETYQDTYLAIRAKYGHPDAPVLYRGRVYCETLPPKGWDRATYTAYLDEVLRLGEWYRAAQQYAAKRRKTDEDRAEYDQACGRLQVDDGGARFAGEPEPALFTIRGGAK